MSMEIKIEYLEFLDALRETGIASMYVAIPYLIEIFPELNEEQAIVVLNNWIATIGLKHK